MYFSVLAIADHEEATATWFLTFVANYSLFPLLYTPELTPLKTILFILYQSLVLFGYVRIHKQFTQSILESLYLLGFFAVFVYEHIFHEYVFHLQEKLPFLPLLMVSFYCSIGVTYFWLKYYYKFLTAKCEVKNIPMKKKMK